MAESPSSKDEFTMLKAEQASRETAMGSFLSIGLVSSISLLSALLAIAMRDSAATSLEPEFAFTLLAPLILLLPFGWLILGHRREIHKIGAYLQAFYDERSVGTRWELRVEAFRQHFERRHTLDAVPILIWAVFALCSVAFSHTSHRLHGHPSAFFILLLPFILLVRFHLDWRASAGGGRQEYHRNRRRSASHADLWSFAASTQHGSSSESQLVCLGSLQ